MVFYRPRIHCPSCGFEGVATVKGASAGAWLLWLVSIIVTVFVPIFVVVVAVLFLVLLFSSRTICPSCKVANVVKLKEWKARNPEPVAEVTKECPACAETIKAAAIKCRYCGEEQPTVDTEPEVDEAEPEPNPERPT